MIKLSIEYIPNPFFGNPGAPRYATMLHCGTKQYYFPAGNGTSDPNNWLPLHWKERAVYNQYLRPGDPSFPVIQPMICALDDVGYYGLNVPEIASNAYESGPFSLFGAWAVLADGDLALCVGDGVSAPGTLWWSFKNIVPL